MIWAEGAPLQAFSWNALSRYGMHGRDGEVSRSVKVTMAPHQMQDIACSPDRHCDRPQQERPRLAG